ncbi:hypothetical protein MesoLjLb_06240 [Mesorhizobium sp. L-8-3]|nr:hypothetical protein MesoLjLb_06240 [Mesorhizobium sp. L-8-3]
MACPISGLDSRATAIASLSVRAEADPVDRKVVAVSTIAARPRILAILDGILSHPIYFGCALRLGSPSNSAPTIHYDGNAGLQHEITKQ